MKKLAIFATLLAACTSQSAPDFSSDTEAPLLTVTSPERGTMSDQTSVTVTGRVEDASSGVETVSINGNKTKVGSDGTFSATVTIGEGVQIITTEAADRAGNITKDTRAVMAGTLAKVSDPVSDAVVAHLGPDALTSISSALGRQATVMDFTAQARAANPIAESGGSCLGFKANLESIQKGPVTVGISPQTGALGATVEVKDLEVRVKVNFKAACIGGSTTVKVRARSAKVDAKLAMAAAAGVINADMTDLAVTFDGFNIDASGIPGALIDLVQNKVNNAAIKAIQDAIKNAVPTLVESELAELSGTTFSQDLFGKAMNLTIGADKIAIAPTGVDVSLNGKVTLAGGESAEYISNPMPAGAAMGAVGNDAGIGISDDFANQLFAGAWAAGALDLSFPLGAQVPGSGLFGDSADKALIEVMLPPTISTGANGELKLAIGDAIITVKDKASADLAKFVMSLELPVTLGVDATGKPTLNVGKPAVFAQILSQSEDLPLALNEDLVKGIAEVGATQLSTLASQAMTSMPIPMQQNLQQVQIHAKDGYLTVGAKLAL